MLSTLLFSTALTLTPPLAEVFPKILFSDFLRYFIPAATGFGALLIWRCFRGDRRRIQSRKPGLHQYVREFAYSMLTVAIFACVGYSIYVARQLGHTRIYEEIAEHGWMYFGASIAIMLVVHDAYFYWTHRLMHWRPLFRWFHLVHHRSTAPSPWAAYAFAPLEALVQAGIFPLLVFGLPLHPGALFIFLTIMIVRNVWGHLGFEFFPRSFVQSQLTNWSTTTTHHDMHHRYFNCNYGLYFSFWDRLLGTTHARYEDVFARVTGSEERTTRFVRA